MNAIFKEKIRNRDYASLIDYKKLNAATQLAVPSLDHYYPLLYSLALQDNQDNLLFFNDKAVGGYLTMTSVKIG